MGGGGGVGWGQWRVSTEKRKPPKCKSTKDASWAGVFCRMQNAEWHCSQRVKKIMLNCFLTSFAY